MIQCFIHMKISLGIRKLDLRNKIIAFGTAELTSPSFSLITDSSGVSEPELVSQHA